jgi:hypothetical protein
VASVSYPVLGKSCSMVSSLKRVACHDQQHTPRSRSQPGLLSHGLHFTVKPWHFHCCLMYRRLKTGERRSCSGHLSAFIRMLEAISTYNEALEPSFKQLVADTNTFRVLNRRQRILHHVFDV